VPGVGKQTRCLLDSPLSITVNRASGLPGSVILPLCASRVALVQCLDFANGSCTLFPWMFGIVRGVIGNSGVRVQWACERQTGGEA
jgi:hypothetical protein